MDAKKERFFRNVYAEKNIVARCYFEPDRPEQDETIYFANRLRFKVTYPKNADGGFDINSQCQFLTYLQFNLKTKKPKGGVKIGTVYKLEDASREIVLVGQHRDFACIKIGSEVFSNKTETEKGAA